MFGASALKTRHTKYGSLPEPPLMKRKSKAYRI